MGSIRSQDCQIERERTPAYCLHVREHVNTEVSSSEPDREIEEAGDKRERREGREKGSYIHSCRDAYPFPFHMRGRLVRRLVGFWPWLGSGHTLTHPYAHSHIRTHMGPNPCRSSPIATHIALCDASPAPATTNHRDAQPCAILLRRRGRAAWPTLPGAQLVCAE